MTIPALFCILFRMSSPLLPRDLFMAIGRVRYMLKLFENKTGHDQGAFEESRITDISDATIDNDTCIQDTVIFCGLDCLGRC